MPKKKRNRRQPARTLDSRPDLWVKRYETKHRPQRLTLSGHHDLWQVVAHQLDVGRSNNLFWPAYVYAPVGAMVTWSGERGWPIDPGECATITALASWRQARMVYRFDADLARALAQTPIKGDLPVELLRSLPVWCPYLDLRAAKINAILGAFVHLEHDPGTGAEELRLVLDLGEVLLPMPIHLVGGLEEGVEAAMRQAMLMLGLGEGGPAEALKGDMEAFGAIFSGVVSCALWLCSARPEIEPRGRRTSPHPSEPHHAPLPTQPSPRVWDVGVRMGAALRQAVDAGERERSPSSGGGTSPRPHVRAGHWHTVRYGERKAKARLQWYAPMVVGGGEGVTTVRAVKGQA